MKKKSPTTKKISDLDKYMLQCQINAHKAILELTDDIRSQFELHARQQSYKIELERLEKRYRNEFIISIIGWSTFIGIISLIVYLILK